MLRIRKLDIFIVKQFGLLFVGTFFISLFVCAPIFLYLNLFGLCSRSFFLHRLCRSFFYSLVRFFFLIRNS